MQIGLACDLKEAVRQEMMSDDALEEYDSLETIEIITSSLENLGHTVTMLNLEGLIATCLHSLSSSWASWPNPCW